MGQGGEGREGSEERGSRGPYSKGRKWEGEGEIEGRGGTCPTNKNRSCVPANETRFHALKMVAV